MKEQEFWRDRSSGRLYAVELHDGIVTGSAGPLSASELEPGFLATFDYASDEAAWLEEHREGFDLYRCVPPHSGGETGRPYPELDRLTVAHAMHPGVITCLPDASLRRVSRTMTSARVHAVVVWGDEEDDSEGIWGAISDLDLITAVARGETLARAAVGASGTPVATIGENASLQRAAELMERHGVTHLVVLAEGRLRPVGVLSSLDVARVLGSEPHA
ncbi:MAG TPA: CBS domain-containing protein [Gaiellaceae bacterium]|jgi:CBS domain-containing protein